MRKRTEVQRYECTLVLIYKWQWYESVKVQSYNSKKVLKYECTFNRGPAIESLVTGTEGG